MREVPPPPKTPAAFPSAHAGVQACPDCGHENTGEFCAGCGQKRLHPGDLTLRHAWHHVLHELVHLDGKIFRTVKVLFTRPGQLTLDFLEGRRARHIHPLRLFLVIGAVFFLVAHESSPVDLRATYERNLHPAGRTNFERALANTGLSYAEFFERANARMAPLFKSVYIAAVMVQGFWLWVLFRRRRACLAENLTMALHLACFSMSLWIIASLAHWLGVTRWVTIPLLAVVGGAYYLFAGRRVYAAGWLRIVGSWLVLFLSSGLIMGTSAVVVLQRVMAEAHTAVAVGVVAEPTVEGAAITPRERTRLFDGRSLAGWVFVAPVATTDIASVWTAVDGEIRCTGSPQGYLRTQAGYRDYVLRFEWRWLATPGNSGVFVHVTGVDRIWPLCLEVQLQTGEAGTVRTNGGASIHEVLPPAPNPRQVSRRVSGTEKTAGEWNVAEVVCRGDQVAITINGVLQNEATRATVSAGAIALQSEGAPIAFRHIEIAPLPAP